MMRLTGKVAVVTGGTSGIGRRSDERFVRRRRPSSSVAARVGVGA